MDKIRYLVYAIRSRDLREPVKFVACARQGPGNVHARRGAIDVIAPERRRRRRLVYLMSVSFHTGHLHVLLKAAHLRSEH